MKTKETRRVQLVESVLDCLKRIRKGDPVRPGGSTVFCSTVEKCLESRIGLTELPDGRFPMLILDTQTTTSFTTEADASAYDAVFPVTIYLVTKDPSKPKIGSTRQWRLLETLFVDVSRALHCGDGSDPCSIGGQATLTIDTFTIHETDDPTFGIASVDISIFYSEILSVP